MTQSNTSPLALPSRLPPRLPGLFRPFPPRRPSLRHDKHHGKKATDASDFERFLNACSAHCTRRYAPWNSPWTCTLSSQPPVRSNFRSSLTLSVRRKNGTLKMTKMTMRHHYFARPRRSRGRGRGRGDNHDNSCHRHGPLTSRSGRSGTPRFRWPRLGFINMIAGSTRRP